MVAISLYRGNLHKVPDVPRRWLMPKHTISIKDFKSLVRKREKALSRLLPPAPPSNPNPSSFNEFVGDNGGCSKQNNNNLQITIYQAPPQLPAIDDPVVVSSKNVEIERVNEGDAKDQSRSDGVEVPEGDLLAQKDEDKQREDTAVEIKTAELQKSEKEKKKLDLEEKLKDLNERKHKLVQMLKQILNAEEEIKRRSNIPLISAPSASQQVDLATTVLNKIGAEAANCFGDLEGESEDNNNNNTNARQSNQQQTLLHSPTTPSPPPSSPLGKLSHASSLHPASAPAPAPAPVPSPTSQPCQVTTTSAGVTSSPSRFAPPSGNPPFGNLTPILSTMSAPHCTASSPSPVASGGTSVFRDPRITSPSWS